MTAIVKTAIAAVGLVTISGASLAVTAPPKSGTTPYTTHFLFVPKSTVDIPGVGKAIALEATGPTQNTAGESFLDKMNAKCAAVSVETGGKKWIDGACALTDAEGDVVFSTFDTRELDKAQPKMDCGTHTITGGTGKYKGITGKEPFSCVSVKTPAGAPEGAFALDIPHNTTWEIR
ncbi:MAG: hypothetical protein ACT4OU_00740 [Hyphomicrobium sp.]